jgi:hypothetical protein
MTRFGAAVFFRDMVQQTNQTKRAVDQLQKQDIFTT